MTRITICPHYLTDYNLTTPQDIELNVIKPLIQCLKLAQENGIPVVLSKEVLRIHRQSFPWNLSVDPEWAKYLSMWDGYITSYLTKATIIAVSDFTPSLLSKCNHIQSNTALQFSRFLEVFGQGEMHGGTHEEGIFASINCDYPQELNRYFLLTDLKDISVIKFPWLRIYDRDLPITGEFHFSPPSNWRNFDHPIKASTYPYGYLDNAGNKWEWDRMHRDHWDVQHSEGRGNYSNVSIEGTVLSRQ